MMDVSGKLVFFAVITVVIARVVSLDKAIPVIGMTTGINQQTGEKPMRLDVNFLANNGGPVWDLFIRGLDSLQQRPENDPKSHFGVAGVHGMPYQPYNGVAPDLQGSGLGYCPHMETQFIAWHRAYVALYEQILGEEVQQLASEYTGDDAAAYHDAAQKFRLPFWDWAYDSSLPPSCVEENVTVNGPQGPITLHNPLYNYRWQTYPLNPNQFPGSGDWAPTTTRDGANGFDPEVVNMNLQGASTRIKDSVYRTFVSSNTFEEMSSMANSGSSFEAPHNDIHNLVGGSFLNLDVTSFDALFMLHHANLDRLAALWSVVHHNITYQTDPYITNGLYSTPKGEMITVYSPLKPFYQEDGKTFHTGMSASSTEAFGYTYVELMNKRLDPDARRKSIISQINKLYGSPPAAGGARKGLVPRQEWFVAVQVERADLELPSSIDIYVGDDDDDLAGRMVLLGMPTAGLAHDEIPLGRAIGILNLTDADLDTIFRTLRDKLRVQIKKGDGTTVDPSGVPSLRLEVANENISPASSDSEFPTYGNRNYSDMVFSGIKGGWGSR
ncbi:Di-copper centre-containing protein [Biscogniauxia marginata]|nr:Di-copper centre-containing protein [Biscogniauxia marginata]